MFQIDNKAPDADMLVVQTDDGHVTISRDEHGEVHVQATCLSRGNEQYAVLGQEGVSEGWEARTARSHKESARARRRFENMADDFEDEA